MNIVSPIRCKSRYSGIIWIGVLLGFTALTPAMPCKAVVSLPAQPGQYDLEMHYAGAKRSYILHIPPQYNGRAPLPLVLAFHGGAGNASQFLGSTGLAKKADREGFILVAPNGNGVLKKKLLTWNVRFGFGYALKNHVDDVGFVRKLINRLENGLLIKPDRIYATGISNGAMLCHLLAARLSEKIAAIAPVVGSVGGKQEANGDYLMPPSPAFPVAVIAFNGKKDMHVPYEGGIQKKFISKTPVFVTPARTMHRFWTQANGCNGKAEKRFSKRKKYMTLTFKQGCRGSEVVQYLIFDQGHAWPGGKKGWGFADAPSRHISANDVMWDFFKAHRKN